MKTSWRIGIVALGVVGTAALVSTCGGARRSAGGGVNWTAPG